MSASTVNRGVTTTTPGHVWQSGAINENARMTRSTLGTPPTHIGWTVRVRVEELSIEHPLGGWLNAFASFRVWPDNTLTVAGYSGGAVGGAASSPIPGGVLGRDLWFRGIVQFSDAMCSYWYSAENIEDPALVTWTSLGTPIGSRPGLTASTSNSGSVMIGATTPAGPTGVFAGRIYYWQEQLDLSPSMTADFQGTKKPANVWFSTVTNPVDPVKVVTFVPRRTSSPETRKDLWVDGKRVWPLGNGYLRAPAVVAQHHSITTPSNAGFTVDDLDVRWFGRLIDWSQSGGPFAHWTTTSDQRGWLMEIGGRQARLSLSTDGINQYSSTLINIPYADGQPGGLRITRPKSTGVTTLWFSYDGVVWTPQSATTVMAAGSAPFRGSYPVGINGYGSIGHLGKINGDMYYAEMRSSIDGPVLYRVGPESFRGLAPNQQTWTGETGHVLTRSYNPGLGNDNGIYPTVTIDERHDIYRGDQRVWPGADGYVSLDGTVGTELVASEEIYLWPRNGNVTTPDPGPLPTNCLFIMKVRGPNSGPTGALSHRVFEQHSNSADNSWSVRRYASTSANNGDLDFHFSTDGSSSMTAPRMTMPDVTNADEWLAIAQNLGPMKSGTGYYSSDGVTWTAGGTWGPNAYAPIWDTSLPLSIGYSVNLTIDYRFNGRIYSVELHNATDPNTVGSVSYSDNFNRVSDAVVAYNFTESGTSVIDRSGNGNNGLLQNNTSPLDLHSSGELRLNGSQYNLQYTPSVYPTAASVSMRIRCPAGVWSRGSFWSFMNGMDTSGFNLCTTETANGSVYGIVRGASGVAVITSASGTLVQGGTITLALTYDGTTARMYKDGIEIGSSTGTSGNLNLTPGNTFRIGYNPSNPNAGFAEFYVDDVRFFHRALSQPEVAALVGVPVTVEGAGAGAGWVADAGYTISGNQMTKGAGDAWARYATDLGSPDHWVEANIVNQLASGCYTVIRARANAANRDCYQAYASIDTSTFVIGKNVSNVYSNITLGSSFTSPFTGKLKLEVQGSTLKLYVNDVLDITTTDTSVTAGSFVGVNGFSGGSNENIWDNFVAGTGSLMWKFDAKDYRTAATRTAGCLHGGSNSGAVSDSTHTITTDIVLTARCTMNTGANAQYIANCWTNTSTTQGWWFGFNSAEALQFGIQDTALFVQTFELLSTAEVAALGVLGSTTPVDIGVRFELNVAGSCRAVCIRSTDGGATWNEIGTAKTGTAVASQRVVTSPVAVGTRSDRSTSLEWVAASRIYKAEMRTGTDPNGGTVIWGFDPAEYPVSDTTTVWTDPRGRTWTILHPGFMGEVAYADPRGRVWTVLRNTAIEGMAHNTGNVGSAEVVVRPHSTWIAANRLVAKWGDPGDRCWQFQVSSTTGKLQFVYSWTGSADDAGWSYTETTAAVPFPTTEWVRLKVAWNATTGTIVFSGALDGEALQVLDTKSKTPWTMYQGDAKITVGSIGGGTSYSDSDIRYVSVRDGSGAEVFGIDRESFRKSRRRATSLPSRNNHGAYLDAYGTSRPTLPDPGPLPDEYCLVAKTAGPIMGTAGNRTVCAQGLNTGADKAFQWMLGNTYLGDGGRIEMFPNGSSTGSYAGSPNFKPAFNTLKPRIVALAMNSPSLTSQPWYYENGVWTGLSAGGSTASSMFDSTSPIIIGDDGTASTSTLFDSPIYWVEMRSGLHPARGRVLWRFDANDYPGGGVMSWKDPVGRVWTLIAGTYATKAIIPMVGDIAVRGAARIYPTVSEMKAKWNVSQWGDGTKWSP